jgi:CrcB protein
MNSTSIGLIDFLFVLLGGALGSGLRVLTGIMLHHQTRTPFPYKTFAVNVLGCFVVGWLAMRFQGREHFRSLSLFLVTGFMGAFTTFSTLSFETVSLLRTGHVRTAVFNIVASTVAGLIAVILGMLAGQRGMIG